jgi:hypothetical protein
MFGNKNIARQAHMSHLRAFCDASTKAYGVVGYLCSEDENGSVVIFIVLRKVCGTPVK